MQDAQARVTRRMECVDGVGHRLKAEGGAGGRAVQQAIAILPGSVMDSWHTHLQSQLVFGPVNVAQAGPTGEGVVDQRAVHIQSVVQVPGGGQVGGVGGRQGISTAEPDPLHGRLQPCLRRAQKPGVQPQAIGQRGLAEMGHADGLVEPAFQQLEGLRGAVGIGKAVGLQRVAANVRTLVRQHGAALITNCLGERACLEAAQVTRELRVPLVGPMSGALQLRAPEVQHVFSTRPDDTREADALARQLQSIGISRVVVLGDDAEPARTDALVAALQRARMSR